jgi:hypothetical protein
VRVQALLIAVCGLAACGSSKKTDLFTPKPECKGEAVDPLKGEVKMLISDLTIGDAQDGFDLDGDGKPDNKLSPVGAIALGPLQDAFAKYQLIIPIELFDFPQVVADACVKVAFYLGHYSVDEDGDGYFTGVVGGDCDDHDPNTHPGAPEIIDGKDNNCDGNADETYVATDGGMMLVKSTDTSDSDGDGQTIADGDCDDTNPKVKLGNTETCDDGYDNDCSGVADMGRDSAGNQACSPFDDTPDTVVLDPLSFDTTTGKPKIVFDSAFTDVDKATGDVVLHGGPNLFEVSIPIRDGVNLDVKLTGAQLEGHLVMNVGNVDLMKGRIGGILDAHTLDQVRGLDESAIGLTPQDSLLDAMFANVLGQIVGLHKNKMGCRMPDIDVDHDGLEAFCDSNPADDIFVVDECVDGDGSIFMDQLDSTGAVTKQCTEFTNDDGSLRFVDGVSAELNFDAVAVNLLPVPTP